MTMEDPQGSSTYVNVGNSQSFNQCFTPIVLEQQGNYLLEISSGSNFSANFDLTVVDLEEAEVFTLMPDDVVSLTGTIRMSGDIDRFDFIPNTDGTVIITLKPAYTNGIDDSGNPRIQVRNPDTNGLTSSISENPDPKVNEIYIWEGNVTRQNDYYIHIWDQEAITSGDFELTIQFTPNP